MPRRKTAEGYVLDAVMQYLAAKRIFAIRMNTGALKIDDRFLRFGVPGMADVLAFQSVEDTGVNGSYIPVWIETKAKHGRQSELQRSFQRKVEEEGHKYVLCFGIQDLENVGL